MKYNRFKSVCTCFSDLSLSLSQWFQIRFDPPARCPCRQSSPVHAQRSHAGGVRSHLVSRRSLFSQRRQRQPGEHLAEHAGRSSDGRALVQRTPRSREGGCGMLKSLSSASLTRFVFHFRARLVWRAGVGVVSVAIEHPGIGRRNQRPPHSHLERQQRLVRHFLGHAVSGEGGGRLLAKQNSALSSSGLRLVGRGGGLLF